MREAVKEGEEADGRSEREGRTVKPFDNDGTYACVYTTSLNRQKVKIV